ncbi:ABC transporter permease [Rhodococcus sp. HNM0569]|uniref:ABC transporter permease n=1 Tax=Rhodococcus sp. HNM0569 TaxID=2716340 RepID=UPI00146F1625|nr:ABC transporter permease [Rhodococcus sp. HNM0569]NLU81503.1 ABC transporter permease [Rhodococcus sp. HNM0569]
MITRLWNVARVHTVAWPLLLGWPAGVLLVSFLIPFAIFAIIGDTGNDFNFTGSVSSVFGVSLAFYLAAMTQTFPFALGLSVTRRDYFVATLGVAATQTVTFAVALQGLAVLERNTDGFGVHMRMFDIPGIFTSNFLVQFATYVAFLALVAALGLAIGAVHLRWRVTGLYTVAVAALLALGAAALVITWQRWWPAIGSWFVDVPRVVPMVALPAGLTVVAVAAAWATLRRATA